MLQLEKKEQESLEKAKQYAAQKRELKKRQKDVKPKSGQALPDWCGGIGAGCPAIEEDDIPKLDVFLKRQEANGKFFSKAMQKELKGEYGGSVMPGGRDFPFPSFVFHEGRTAGTTRGRP